MALHKNKWLWAALLGALLSGGLLLVVVGYLGLVVYMGMMSGTPIVESPHRLNGQYLYRTVQRPGVRDFMDLGQGAEIVEIAVSTDAPIVGKSLQEANVDGLIPEQTILVVINRGSNLMVPRGETEVSAGDLVTVFAMNGATTDLMRAFTAER